MATAGCPRAAGRGRHQLLPARVDGGQGNGLPRSPSPWVSWLRRRNRAWAVAATFSVHARRGASLPRVMARIASKCTGMSSMSAK